MAILDGAEAEALTFYVQRLALGVFQGEDSGIEVRLFGVPRLDALGRKVHLCAVAADGTGRACDTSRGQVRAFGVQ